MKFDLLYLAAAFLIFCALLGLSMALACAAGIVRGLWRDGWGTLTRPFSSEEVAWNGRLVTFLVSTTIGCGVSYMLGVSAAREEAQQSPEYRLGDSIINPADLRPPSDSPEDALILSRGYVCLSDHWALVEPVTIFTDVNGALRVNGGYWLAKNEIRPGPIPSRQVVAQRELEFLPDFSDGEHPLTVSNGFFMLPEPPPTEKEPK